MIRSLHSPRADGRNWSSTASLSIASAIISEGGSKKHRLAIYNTVIDSGLSYYSLFCEGCSSEYGKLRFIATSDYYDEMLAIAREHIQMIKIFEEG